MSAGDTRGPTAGSPAANAGGTGSSGALARSILRSAGLILVITVLARIAGFVRYLVFGASVGAGDVGTAYSTANLLPNVLFEIVAGGALAAVVVPLVAGLVPGPGRSRDPRSAERRDPGPQPVSVPDTPRGASPTDADDADQKAAEGEARANRIVSALLTWALLVTVLLAGAIALASEPIARLLLDAEGPAASGVALGARLLRIFAVQLPFYGIAVVTGAYLQARRRFLWPALVPLISSLVVMASYRVYAKLVPPVATAATIDERAVAWLGWGTTAGVIVMALPVLIVALRSGLRLRPTLRMPEGVGRRALALGGAGLGAVGAQQAVLALVMLLAMRAGGTGTLPVFQYAQALYLLPYAVLVVPLVTAVFPQLSEMRLVGDTVGFARVAAASVRTVVVIAVVGASMLIAAAPALEQFFRIVDRAGAAGVGSTTAALALGLAGFAVATQCTRILSAALRARDALIVGSIGWVIAALVIVLLILPSPTRSAAEAATSFGLAIAAGMAASALVGFGRIADIIEPGGHLSRVRRTALLAPPALLLGSVAGYLIGHRIITVDTGITVCILAGILAGAVAAVVSALVMAAADPPLARDLLGRLRHRDGRTVGA